MDKNEHELVLTVIPGEQFLKVSLYFAIIATIKPPGKYWYKSKQILENIYLLKVNNGNTTKNC